MITSAACRAIVNGTRQVFPVHRHPDFFLWMKMLQCDYDKNSVEQGFINWDRESKTQTFVDRKRAFEIARTCGQIDNKRPQQDLFSEDLY